MFKIALEIDSNALAVASPGQPEAEYDLEDGLATQILAACDVLSHAKVASFLVCCGDQPWPVDVWVDLATFLEQCASLLKFSTGTTSSFRLEFYDQGTEAVLVFTRAGDNLRIHCESYWGGECPFPAKEELIMAEDLVRSVRDVVRNFAGCCQRIYPSILELQHINNWVQEIEHHSSQFLRKSVDINK